MPDEVPALFPPNKRKTDVDAWIWGLRYGVTDNFTLGLIQRFLSIEAEVDIDAVGVTARPQVTGFGDTVLLTKYRLWGKRRTHLSAYHLLSIPTGDENAEGEDDGVVRRLPLGSGSRWCD